jgi:hypothetical protein
MVKLINREVVDVKNDLFIVKTLSVEGVSILFAYDRKTINAKFTISQDGKKILYADNDRKLYDFPIFVGKKWTDTGTNFMSEFKIEGIEVATTAVGTFKAYLL